MQEKVKMTKADALHAAASQGLSPIMAIPDSQESL
jgi:hypothetical protein